MAFPNLKLSGESFSIKLLSITPFENLITVVCAQHGPRSVPYNMKQDSKFYLGKKFRMVITQYFILLLYFISLTTISMFIFFWKA